jgi:hypothetical protein
MPRSLKYTQPHQKPLQTEEAWNRIIDTGEDLKILRSLSEVHVKRVTEAIEILKIVQSSPRRKTYQVFLYEVLRKCGPPAVLVCAIALGQVKAANMKTHHRVDLARRLVNSKDNSSFNHPTIHSLALLHHVPTVDGTYSCLVL